MPGLTNRAHSAAMEIHKTIISAIEKTAQAWAEEHEETETLEINIPGSNVNVLSEIIERHMRDPGTSIIRWTRYDGTPETLPDINRDILVYWANKLQIRTVCTEVRELFDVDDVWAHLPCPPEAAQ